MTSQILPAILGALRQERAEGELVLEQNDGCRRFYWRDGNLIHLQSDVAGEQLGSYLLRQGILDYPTLSELLDSDESFRFGDKVVQWGLMTVEEREFHLLALQEQIMLHAVEHQIVRAVWNQGPIAAQLSADLHFGLNHRLFIWNTLSMIRNLQDLCDLLYEEDRWRWTAPLNLLEVLQDLPLDPSTAFALSFLGPEPVGYQTLMSITGLDEEEAARLIVLLWALGALTESSGTAPTLASLPSSRPRPTPPSRIPPVIARPHAESVPPKPTPVVPPMPRIPLAAAPPPAPMAPQAEPSAAPAAASAPAPTPAPSPAPMPTPLHLDAIALEHPVMEIQTPAGRVSMVQVEEPEADPEECRAMARRMFLKAKSYLLQERTAEAVRLLEESVKLNADQEGAFEAWLLLGKVRMANPAWSTRALQALQSASRLKPKTGEPWGLMGELYHRKGFKANAVACFKRALELDPSVPVPVDMTYLNEEPGPAASSTSTNLLGRFRAILSRKEGE